MGWVPLRALWNCDVAIYMDGLVQSPSGSVMPLMGILAQGSRKDRRRLQRTFQSLAQLLNAMVPPDHPLAVTANHGGMAYLLIELNSQMQSLTRAAAANALATQPAFQSCLRKLGGTAGAVLYCNVKKTVALLNRPPMLRSSQNRKALNNILLNMGATRAGRFVMTAGFRGRDMAYSAFLSLKPDTAPDAENPQMMHLSRLLSRVPSDATTVEFTRGNPFNLLKIYAASIAMLNPSMKTTWHKA